MSAQQWVALAIVAMVAVTLVVEARTARVRLAARRAAVIDWDRHTDQALAVTR